jgi:hypothetical protein
MLATRLGSTSSGLCARCRLCCNEIDVKLGLAIDQSGYVGNKVDVVSVLFKPDILKQWKVWFPETE